MEPVVTWSMGALTITSNPALFFINGHIHISFLVIICPAIRTTADIFLLNQYYSYLLKKIFLISMPIAHQDSKQCLLCHLVSYTLHMEILCSFDIVCSWMKTNLGPLRSTVRVKVCQGTRVTDTYTQELQISVWSICVYLLRRLLLPLLCRVMETIFSETMIILDVKKVSTNSS